MPDLTPRVGIKKPLGNENVTRASFNENWDIIDEKVATVGVDGKVPVAQLPSATTSAAGIAQLNDNINSTSTSQAATANAVKMAYDKANGAQLFKLTQDNGYTSVPPQTDLNLLITSGFYYGNNLVNSPDGSTNYYRVWCMMASTTSGLQIAILNGGDQWVRNISGGSWGRWVKQLNDNTPTYTTLTLQNGATSTNKPAKYAKVGSVVYLVGEIESPAPIGVIGTLPAGFRPAIYAHTFRTSQGSSVAGEDATIAVNTDGTVQLLVQSNNTKRVSLAGISFIAEQ